MPSAGSGSFITGLRNKVFFACHSDVTRDAFKLSLIITIAAYCLQ